MEWHSESGRLVEVLLCIIEQLGKFNKIRPTHPVTSVNEGAVTLASLVCSGQEQVDN